jgi:hypothetical protein
METTLAYLAHLQVTKKFFCDIDTWLVFTLGVVVIVDVLEDVVVPSCSCRSRSCLSRSCRCRSCRSRSCRSRSCRSRRCRG